MEPWKLVLDEAVLHFFASSRLTERRQLLSALEQLRSDPQREAHYVSKDAAGRDLSVIAIRPFLITYWLDMLIREIRIINIERVRF